MKDFKKSYTYADSGVNINKVIESHKLIAKLLKGTFKSRKGRFGEVLGGIGHYAGLLNLGNGTLLAVHVDGVGTKTMIATMMDKYDTIGFDCIAMNVNDLICMGAEPIAIVDYLAVDRVDGELIKDIMKGLVEGAERADVAIVGGETAVMPDLINGFDLAAMSLGVVKEDTVITGQTIVIDDIIIGLESSGIHSNGLTLARKVLLPHYRIDQFIPELERSLGAELLEPTSIYVKPVLEIIQQCEVHGLAHITGGAFTKLSRIGSKIGFSLDAMPDPKPIFTLIQRHGNLDEREMYRTFNMGIGFCILTSQSEYSKIERICHKYKVKCFNIGKVRKTPRIRVKGIEIY